MEDQDYRDYEDHRDYRDYRDHRDYRYPVYVECSGPVEARLKGIQTYFQIRRKSGGGECGPLRKVKGHVFRVDFKHQKDQQAVLQRSHHVVDGLELIVRDHQEPRTSSPSQDPPAPEESAEAIPATTPPSSGGEHELRPDPDRTESPEAVTEPEAGLGDGFDPRSQSGPSSGGPEDGTVHVDIVQGTIETQQVDALVSPMVGDDPLSTSIGNVLFQAVGPQLTARFRKAAGEDHGPGDAVLVDNLPNLPSTAVFFLNLLPWDDDADGCPLQVLRLAIRNTLSCCESRGFGSVALPVLGAGIALGFPVDAVAKVLMEEVRAIVQNRVGGASLLVRVVIQPDDQESSEVFKSFQEESQPDKVSSTRIVLVGKTGSGKSHLANTIFGEELFGIDDSANSGTSRCKAETRPVNGRSITLIDTPGFFDANRPEEEVKPEIVKCIVECAPGPHAFLIVLKVEKFTKHEQAIIDKICEYFSPDVLKYAVIVFTHGDQLREGRKIKDFVNQNKNLKELVRKCGGRCHVMDNRYWTRDQQSNQTVDLLATVEKMVAQNNGGFYTNEMFQEVEKQIEIVEEHIKEASSGNATLVEIRNQAKSAVSDRFLIELAGTATGALVGAFFGVATMVGLVLTALRNITQLMNLLRMGPPLAGGGAGLACGVVMAGAAVGGGVMGGMIGYEAAKEAKTPLEAAEMAFECIVEKGKAVFKKK